MDLKNKKNKTPFSSIDDAMDDIRSGKVIIIVDDRSLHNEGVFFQAAEKVTSSSVNFFITHARGLIFLPCEQKRLNQLKIPMMSRDTENSSANLQALAISIDARSISRSGVSARDRVKTIKTFIDPDTTPEVHRA